MFKKVNIPQREFHCELKHRPPDDNSTEFEELIDTLILEVPRLKDSNLEKQWAIAQLWNKLHEPEFVDKGINQIFMFTANFEELIIRVEVNEFEDEPAKKLSAPDPVAFENWQNKVAKKFKILYGITVKQWNEQI